MEISQSMLLKIRKPIPCHRWLNNFATSHATSRSISFQMSIAPTSFGAFVFQDSFIVLSIKGASSKQSLSKMAYSQNLMTYLNTLRCFMKIILSVQAFHISRYRTCIVIWLVQLRCVLRTLKDKLILCQCNK
jgi:hypothetical protein